MTSFETCEDLFGSLLKLLKLEVLNCLRVSINPSPTGSGVSALYLHIESVLSSDGF